MSQGFEETEQESTARTLLDCIEKMVGEPLEKGRWYKFSVVFIDGGIQRFGLRDVTLMEMLPPVGVI